MSQLYDLASTFKSLGRKYDWTFDETTANLLQCLNALQWSLVYPPPRNEDETINWGRLIVMELEATRELLNGSNHVE